MDLTVRQIRMFTVLQIHVIIPFESEKQEKSN